MHTHQIDEFGVNIMTMIVAVVIVTAVNGGAGDPVANKQNDGLEGIPEPPSSDPLTRHPACQGDQHKTGNGRDQNFEHHEPRDLDPKQIWQRDLGAKHRNLERRMIQNV
jgi:hypothetical protein